MVLKLTIRILLCFCAFLALIMLLPGSILLDVRPQKFPHSLPKSMDKFKTIEQNNVVSLAKIDLAGNQGPESLAMFQGKIVTGSVDSTIYLLENDQAKPLTKIIDDDDDDSQLKDKTRHCLGLAFDSQGVLFAVVAYYGVYRIENIFTKTPKVSLIMNIDQTAKLAGGGSKFLDDLTIEERSNGKHILYITDVSTKFHLNEVLLIVLGSDTSGRILRLDMETNQLDTVADNLLFPNGIEMTYDNSAFIFSEFATRTIWRYWLKGDKKGTREIILTELPGEVDNIRKSITGDTYWAAMFQPRSMFQPSEMDYYLKKPLLRKLMLRTIHLIGTLLHYVNMIMPNDYVAEIARDFRTMNLLHNISPVKNGMVIEIDSNGQIINSIYGDELRMVTEVREVPSGDPKHRTLYLGSYTLPFVRKMIIST